MYEFFRREIFGIQELIPVYASKFRNFSLAKLDFVSFLFLFCLSAKVLAGGLIASFYLTELFLPFVDFFIESGFSDPYQQFFVKNSISQFPYPALMLYLMTAPKILFGWIAPNSLFLNLLLLRLPILVADLSIYLILKGWLREKFHKRLVYFYWLSPVLFYISYIHGQLDVIPIALLFGCLHYLFKDKYLKAALLFGLALSTKTNVIIIYPFFILFMISRQIGVATIIRFLVLSAASFLLINLPFLSNLAFYQSVFFNKESMKLFDSYLMVNDLKLFLLPAALFLLFVKGGLLKHYNKDIFMMFLGFSFSIVLLFVPPSAGWYFWLIPFLSYFYVKKNGRSHLIFASLSGFYILYFLVIKNSDYFVVLGSFLPSVSNSQNLYFHLASLGLDADMVVNIVYTGLQASLLVNCFWIYKEGLENYQKDKITASPFLIGIGGNSGVGKTTISSALSKVFGSFNTSILRGDDMHKWKRNDKMWTELTHLDPRANHLHKEVNYLKTLKSGQKIMRRNYDHSTGEFTADKPLKPNNVIIYEGLHPFYLPSQRGLYDLKIFLQPSNELMYHWKILRDIKKRGYSKEKVIESIKNREKDAHQYIDTQQDKAEFLIEALPVNPIENIGCESEKVDIYYKLKLSNMVYLEPLMADLSDVDGLNVKHWYTEDDRQIVTIAGTASQESIQKIGLENISDLEELGVESPDWPEELFGVLTLVLTYYILEKSKI